jgi:hypothetical protein
MTTLAADKPRAREHGAINSLPVIAADIIYEGAMVGDNGSGYARPLVAGDPFRGVALRKVDNSAGAAGDKRVELETDVYVELPITSLAITDVGKDVFASDDDTFTLTQSTNTRVGYVHRWVSTGVGIIRCVANRGVITEVTAITGGEAPTEAEHNLVITAVNALIRRLGY